MESPVHLAILGKEWDLVSQPHAPYHCPHTLITHLVSPTFHTMSSPHTHHPPGEPPPGCYVGRLKTHSSPPC